jgi:DNA repair exonuclease SbcCD ATPase subunit
MLKIAHISDVHWRSLKRHDEYRDVFAKLFSSLKEEEPNLIFIGGDIVHSKTQGITPELIDCLHWWFNSLADIAETHIILGNHDGLILNEDRQDAITPIISALNNPRLKLYKKSGNYQTDFKIDNQNLNWCIFSCFDEKGWKNVRPVENRINIACFHGAVWGSKTDVDWELEGEVNLNFFDGYDFVFLGDIHKLQYLDKEKRVAYPGSTIQQNYGEDIKKGYLIWDIKSKYEYKSKFVSIDNPRAFITIDWRGSLEETISFCEKVKSGVRFRVRSNCEISQAEIKVLHHYLKFEKKAHEIVYQNTSTQSNADDVKIEDKNITSFNIRKTTDRKNLITSFFEDLNEDTFDKVESHFVSHLDKIPENFLDVHGQKWSINSMEFENTFAYGKGNNINFKNLNGVIGIFGNNRAGKSSIPGTMMYTLFNTTDRGSIKNQDVVNTRKGMCKSKINFSVGTSSYEVIRETSKKTNKKGITSATTKLELINLKDQYSLDETEEQRRETEKILRKLIGTSDDFLYTTFASQGEMNTFIREKSSARKSVLSKFLHLEIYEDLYRSSRENYIVLKNRLKNTSEKNWVVIEKECSQTIVESNLLKSELKTKLSCLREKDVELKIEQRKIEDSFKSHPSGLTYDKAMQKLNFVENKIASETTKQKSYNQKLNENCLKIKTINEFKDSYSIEDLENDKENLDNLKNKLDSFNAQKASLTKQNNGLRKELRILDNVPCEDKFLSCMFIKNAHEAKIALPSVKAELDLIIKEITNIESTFNKLSSDNIEKNIKRYNDILNKEYKISLENESLKEKQEISNIAIQHLFGEEKKFTELCLELKNYTDDIQSKKLGKVKQEIKQINDLIYTVENDIRRCEYNVIELNSKIEENRNNKVEYQNLVEEWKSFDLFSTAVSKKGIPTMLIRNSLPKINNEIKSILSGVVGFTITLEDSSNALEVYIDYGDSKRIIECASGMEKMIASIAIRVALINISSLPKSDMFIIDEGFGALDSTNIESCGRLLQSLRKFFKSIIVISHVDAIKDIVDKNIEITTRGNDSYVEFK